MSRIILSIQEKGGCYKTFLLIHLVEFLASRGKAFHPVDLDSTPGLTSKVFQGDTSSSVDPEPMLLRSGESQFPKLMEAALEGNSLAIDCGANTGIAWWTLFRETWQDLPALLEQKGVKITLLVPVTNDSKTVTFFARYRDLFPHATIVLVIVRQFEKEEFPVPAHPAELTIELPLPPPKLFATYVNSLMPIGRLEKSERPEHAGIRGFARGYLPKLHSQFARIEQHLTP